MVTAVAIEDKAIQAARTVEVIRAFVGEQWWIVEADEATALAANNEIKAIGPVVYKIEEHQLSALAEAVGTPLSSTLAARASKVEQKSPDGELLPSGTFVVLTIIPEFDEELPPLSVDECLEQAEEKILELVHILSEIDPGLVPLKSRPGEPLDKVLAEAFRFIIRGHQAYLVTRQPLPMKPMECLPAMCEWAKRVNIAAGKNIVGVVNILEDGFTLPVHGHINPDDGQVAREASMRDFIAANVALILKKDGTEAFPIPPADAGDLTDMLRPVEKYSGCWRLQNEILRIVENKGVSPRWKPLDQVVREVPNADPSLKEIFERMCSISPTMLGEELYNFRKKLWAMIKADGVEAGLDVLDLAILVEGELLARLGLLTMTSLRHEKLTVHGEDVTRRLALIHDQYIGRWEAAERRLIELLTKKTKIQHVRELARECNDGCRCGKTDREADAAS